MEERFEFFKEAFLELSNSDKITLFLEYGREYNSDEEIFIFDEDFFSMFYENNPYEAARAATFGSLCWSDDYICFDGYGNLESLSESDAAERAEDFVREIYNYVDYSDYIDMSEFDDREEEEEEEDEEEEDNEIVNGLKMKGDC